MKIKHIIVTCLMVTLASPMHAQEEGNPSDKVDPPQKETGISPQENHELNTTPHTVDPAKKVGTADNNDSKKISEKRHGNTISSSQSSPSVDTGQDDSNEQTQGNNNSFGGIESEDAPNQNATVDASHLYEQQSLGEDGGSNWGFIALIIALISLLVTGYNYMVSQPKKSNRKGRNSRQQESSTTERDILNKINIVNRDLQSRINQLSHRIEDLETQVNSLSLGQSGDVRTRTRSDNQFRPVSQGDLISNSSPIDTDLKLYASQVLSDSFPGEGLSEENNDYTIAILSIKGDCGTFVINDRATAQSFLISNFAYGAGRVSDVKHQGDNPTRIETMQPGSIKRQANGWKITANAQVRIV